MEMDRLVYFAVEGLSGIDCRRKWDETNPRLTSVMHNTCWITN